MVIETNQTVTLNAPKGSASMKSSEKGIGTSLHRFSFSQVSYMHFKIFFYLNLADSFSFSPAPLDFWT